jgi:hypothetical protein
VKGLKDRFLDLKTLSEVSKKSYSDSVKTRVKIRYKGPLNLKHYRENVRLGE